MSTTPAHTATKVQTDLSNPHCSAWAVAHAGTGKTHILVRRFLRLILEGAQPERILCLSFTRTAATEMRQRIFHHLGRWHRMDDKQLTQELKQTLGKPPNNDQKKRARKLFSRCLDSIHDLHIRTIHAFCQIILSRFPMEAEVQPYFQVLEQTEPLEDRAFEQLLHHARDNGELRQ